tara:strand:+ start:82 stop:318 length:237 start_codon:yes stop_codon:yes gene_type:complete
MKSIDPSEYYVDSDDDEYLIRIVVDVSGRRFWLYSNEGNTRSVDCDSVDEFMNVLDLVRIVVDDEIISYTEPLVKNQL